MESPFNHLLATNLPPPDSELPTINAIIKSHKAVALGLDAVITDIRNTLKALKDRRASHLQTVQQHESLRSPVRRLPAEILSIIFLMYSSVAQRPGPSSNLNRHNPAVVLSHVCSRWRSTALDTAPLWSRVIISPPSYPELGDWEGPRGIRTKLFKTDYHAREVVWEERLRRAGEMLAIWIARSKRCPLAVTFRFEENFGVFQGNSVPSQFEVKAKMHERVSVLVDLLCKHSLRWEEAAFNIVLESSDSPILRLIQMSPEQVPALDKLSLRLTFPDDGWGQVADFKRRFHQTATILATPTLQSVRLGMTWVEFPSIPVAWSQLTELAFTGYDVVTPLDIMAPYFTPIAALNLLRECPNLQYCALLLDQADPLAPWPGWQANSGPLTLPFLHTLHLSGLTPVAEFADALSLPALTTLRLTMIKPSSSASRSATEVLLKTYGPQLKELLVYYTSFTPEFLESCIANLPNVEELALIYDDTRDELTNIVMDEARLIFPPGAAVEPIMPLSGRLLAKMGGSPPWCPKLTRFTCHPSVWEFDEADLWAFITARRGSTRRNLGLTELRKVEVKFRWSQGVWDVRKVLEAIGVDINGLALDVTYDPPPPLAPQKAIFNYVDNRRPFPLTFDDRDERFFG